jgi:hypothetical protein
VADLEANELKPWQRQPQEANAVFVWHMEDVLDVYQRPSDPGRPVVCLDETSRQLLGEVRPPESAVPGRPIRHDPEYLRGGVANLLYGLRVNSV